MKLTWWKRMTMKWLSVSRTEPSAGAGSPSMREKVKMINIASSLRGNFSLIWSFEIYSWSIPSLAGSFDHLKDFSGGLASPFPHTATVESDFSIVKWETDGARTQMEHYSPEGIMQCKEHERMKAVVFGRKLNNWRLDLVVVVALYHTSTYILTFG